MVSSANNNKKIETNPPIPPEQSAAVSPVDLPQEKHVNYKEHYEQSHHIAAIPHEHEDAKIARSYGEKFFNIFTYKGIGWGLNAFLSVYLTDLFKNGGGKPVFEKWAKDFAPVYQKFTGASMEHSIGAARSGLITLGLFSGGTILLYPIKKLEDYKLQIIKWLDKTHNQSSGVSDKELTIQQEVYERIEGDPKPSWPNIILGRFLGTAAVVGVALGLAKGRDEKAADFLADKLCHTMQQTGHSTLKNLGHSDRFKNIASLSFIETYTSLIAEEVLYLTTRIYRKSHRKETLQEGDHTQHKHSEVMPFMPPVEVGETALPSINQRLFTKRDSATTAMESYRDMALQRGQHNQELTGMSA